MLLPGMMLKSLDWGIRFLNEVGTTFLKIEEAPSFDLSDVHSNTRRTLIHLDSGYGDYTKERHEWLDRIDIATIVKQAETKGTDNKKYGF